MKYSRAISLGLNLFFAKIAKRRVPFQVHLRLLEQCNRNCSYCKRDYPFSGIKPPAIGKFLKVIDDFVSLGTRRFTLFGGEPLLYKDIEEIVRRIKFHKVNCSVMTNGSLIEQHKGLLKDIDLLTVSLDGDQQSHDAYRGKGSYNEAICAIKLARSKGTQVQLLCTITNLTDLKLRHLFEIAEYYDCTIDFEQLNPLFNSNGTITLRDEDPGADKIKALIDYQLKYKNPRIVNSRHTLKYIRSWLPFYKIFRLFEGQALNNLKLIKCSGGQFFATVEANGDIFPCCLIRTDYKPVNVFNLGVKSAWESMPQNNCIACRSIGYSMFNSIFSLNINSIFSLLRQGIN
ncbi:MAG: radical SAM protein [Candidatus Omnitrophica bacterium]|nr:radical SAM protein [Candidatus Omnitrophota bacterium]